MKLCLLLLPAFIVVAIHLDAQVKNDTLYKDFDLSGCRTVNPVAGNIICQKGFYICNIPPKRRSKATIEVIKLYSDSGKLYTRKGSIIDMDYGKVIAFKVMKEPGFERVLIFSDWDYHYDSLLIRKDTLYFKAIADDIVELSIVYPENNDTIRVKYANRNTRYDFLKKFKYSPALKNYANWFPDANLDCVETYTLVKKGNTYELVYIDSSSKKKEYEYNSRKEKYAAAGSSPFWLALAELSY